MPIDEGRLSPGVLNSSSSGYSAKASEIISLQTANRIISMKKLVRKTENVDRNTELCAANRCCCAVSQTEPELSPKSFVTQKPDEEETIDVAAISQQDQLTTDF